MNATAMKTQIVKPAVAQRAARPARQAVVVRATAEESRRAVLTGFVAGEIKILAAAFRRCLNALTMHADDTSRRHDV